MTTFKVLCETPQPEWADVEVEIEAKEVIGLAISRLSSRNVKGTFVDLVNPPWVLYVIETIDQLKKQIIDHGGGPFVGESDDWEEENSDGSKTILQGWYEKLIDDPAAPPFKEEDLFFERVNDTHAEI